MDVWDRIRSCRNDRFVDAGLITEKWPLSKWEARVPPWGDAEHKERWGLKMAAYAAQIDRMDHGYVLDTLEEMGKWREMRHCTGPTHGHLGHPIGPVEARIPGWAGDLAALRHGERPHRNDRPRRQTSGPSGRPCGAAPNLVGSRMRAAVVGIPKTPVGDSFKLIACFPYRWTGVNF